MFRILLLLVMLFAAPLRSAEAGMPGSATPPPPLLLTNLRISTPLDVASGENALQLTIDANGALQPRVELVQPTLLRVTVSGANGSKLPKQLALQTPLASSLAIATPTSSSTVLTLRLTKPISSADYRLATELATPGKPAQLKLTITKPLLPLPLLFTAGLRGKTITLDPGHGGSDAGAVGAGNTLEKSVTLAVALQVKTLLEKSGAKVILTRQTDKDVYAPNASAADELGARAAIGNRSLSDLFIDIHADSYSDSSVGGTGTFYFEKSPYDKLLADSLQKAAVGNAGLNDRGTTTAGFFVLKRTRMPAALIELAFISNPNEEKLLATPAFQQKLAQGIVDGLQLFFGEAAKLSKKK